MSDEKTAIDFGVHLMRDGETFGVRYACACGCKPQVKLRRDSAAGHEHCCCGIAHAAGPDARAHLDDYIAGRRESGEDTRAYAVSETRVTDPWGEAVDVAYAVPDVLTPH
jgi:hypothetical protein